jgi:hypothetical protein
MGTYDKESLPNEQGRPQPRGSKINLRNTSPERKPERGQWEGTLR